MYNDYARPWRRFPCALMLLIALSAASCRVKIEGAPEEQAKSLVTALKEAQLL